MGRRIQFADQGVDLAQILPATFLWLQFAIPHQHGEITDFMLSFAWQLFRSRCSRDRGGRFGQMNFEPGGVSAQSDPEIAPERFQF